jgi:hypothetical protein
MACDELFRQQNIVRQPINVAPHLFVLLTDIVLNFASSSDQERLPPASAPTDPDKAGKRHFDGQELTRSPQAKAWYVSRFRKTDAETLEKQCHPYYPMPAAGITPYLDRPDSIRYY